MKFSELHPCVLLLYFIIGLCFISFTQNPILLCIAFVCSFVIESLNSSFMKTVKFVVSVLPLILLIGIVLPLFNHRGDTVLFVLPSGNAFTLESVIYSFCGALTLGCAVLWFRSNRELLSSDNIYVVFGKISPHLALFFTMSLRFVPRIAHNFKTAYSLKNQSNRSFSGKIRAVGSCVISCISLSFEDSLSIAKSMKSRGYGTVKRTFYSPKKFKIIDYICLLLIILASVLVIFAFILDKFECAFYPQFNVAVNDSAVLGYIIYFLFFSASNIFNLCGEIIWKLYH